MALGDAERRVLELPHAPFHTRVGVHARARLALEGLGEAEQRAAARVRVGGLLPAVRDGDDPQLATVAFL